MQEGCHLGLDKAFPGSILEHETKSRTDKMDGLEDAVLTLLSRFRSNLSFAAASAAAFFSSLSFCSVSGSSSFQTEGASARSW